MVEEKNLERKFDSNNVCGITNDQMISMEQLKLGKIKVETEERELFITSLGAETANLEKQIEYAEKRAERRCPTYDENNFY